MDATELREKQAPIKAQFRDRPETAQVTLKATGRIDDDDIVCRVDSPAKTISAGLHPASGGSTQNVCSGDMLLQALVACAGVTLKAVAVALDVELKSSSVTAEGDLDFRGALGVDNDAPVGFSDVRLRFELETDASPSQRARLIELTERYCVVYQTLRASPRLGLRTEFVAAGHRHAPVGMEGVEEAEAELQARLQALRAAASHAL
jgi:uncharacterized OsmC-like protein